MILWQIWRVLKNLVFVFLFQIDFNPEKRRKSEVQQLDLFYYQRYLVCSGYSRKSASRINEMTVKTGKIEENWVLVCLLQFPCSKMKTLTISLFYQNYPNNQIFAKQSDPKALFGRFWTAVFFGFSLLLYFNLKWRKKSGVLAESLFLASTVLGLFSMLF